MSEPTKKRKAEEEEQKPAASKKRPANNEKVIVVDDSASTKQPDHDAGAGFAAAVAATKERKTFEYNILEYSRPIIKMGLLTHIWNNLSDDNPFYEEEDGERQHYMRDMEQLIHTGRADYCNPFGEDDHDQFLGLFYELTQREQKAFLKTAKEKQFIAASDVTKLFEDPPTRPYYVTLKKVTDKYQDGSQRFPFTSMEDAEDTIKEKMGYGREEGYDVVVLDCAPDCKRVECSHPQCQKQVCTEHGLGQGIYYHERGEIVFNFQKCMHCEKNVCERHSFMECYVCSMENGAEESLTGDRMEAGPFPLCQDCGTICERRWKCNDSHLDSEDENSEDTDYSECGFFCCNNHIDHHRCGYEFQDI
jgi:hypothetical protein